MAEKQTAGAFDIRNVIGALLSIYGVVLILVGIFDGDGGPKSGDVNSNLWAGLVLLVVGVFFLVWARMRPVVVADTDKEALEGPPPGH
jgi:uncharacterized membrane protein